jgi:MFS family permease
VARGQGFIADLLVVLRGRDFRKLFATRLSSQAGDGAFQVGLASLFFFSPERAATASAAAAVFTVAVLPYTVIGPVAGVLLDLWPRRQVLLVANAGRAVMVLGVAAMVARGVGGLPLYVAVLACMSVNRFFLAGLGAALPRVVPAQELVMANAVSPTSGTVVAILGGALAYGLRALLSAGDSTDALLLVLAAAWYASSAALAARMPRGLLGPDPSADAPSAAALVANAVRELARDVRAGAAHVHHRRAAAHALAATGAHRFAFGISTIATILVCRNYLSDPADVDAGLRLLALVGAATGLGIAAAALITPPATRRWGTRRWIVACFAAAAGAEAFFVTGWLSVPLLLAGGFAIGLAAQGSKICVDSIVQLSVDDEFRGRVFSLYDMIFNAAFVVAAGVAVVVVPGDGYSRLLYAGIAGLYAITAVGYAWVASAREPVSRVDGDRPTSAATPPERHRGRSAPGPGAVP